MLRYLKAAAWALLAAIVATAIWNVLGVLWLVSSEIQSSGSGGLGAVSAGVSEAIVEVGIIVFIIVFVWRLRRSRRVSQSTGPKRA